MKLNLGCSDRMRPDCLNVDIFIPPGAISFLDPAYGGTPGCAGLFQQADLSGPWPWPNDTIEEIRADDIIEHLPNKIFTMNEAHRVLVRNGILDIFVPTTNGPGAWQDPTHVSYWNRNSFLYYTKNVAEYERFHKSYGITACFRVVRESEKVFPGGVAKLSISLEAVK
jgi:hypothetical protein